MPWTILKIHGFIMKKMVKIFNTASKLIFVKQMVIVLTFKAFANHSSIEFARKSGYF